MEREKNQEIRHLKEGMGREGLARQRAEEQYRNLLDESNSNIQELEKKISDGGADREAAQREIDALTRQLDALKRVPKAPAQDKSEIAGLKQDLAGLRGMLKNMASQPRGSGGGGGNAPIVVQGGAGGGGASSSAGGSSASSGGGGAAPAPARAPDLSGVVEAVKKIAEAKGKQGRAAAGKQKGSDKGITRARRTYTDKRKVKLGELRALKAKRIREFANKTKKMEKKARDKARREYKKKVNAQFKEMQSKFPTARGLKSVSVIRDLIRKIDAIKAAK